MGWESADAETLREIVRAAEAHLTGQVEIATSADQRASTMASAFTLAAGGLAAGMITLAVTAANVPGWKALYAGGMAAAAMFVTAASLSVYASRPVNFWLPGNTPHNWRNDSGEIEALEKMLGDQADYYQRAISRNNKVIGANAKLFAVGAWIGVAAPFCGFLVWLLARYCA